MKLGSAKVATCCVMKLQINVNETNLFFSFELKKEKFHFLFYVSSVHDSSHERRKIVFSFYLNMLDSFSTYYNHTILTSSKMKKKTYYFMAKFVSIIKSKSPDIMIIEV